MNAEQPPYTHERDKISLPNLKLNGFKGPIMLNQEIIKDISFLIKTGKIGIIPTDTMYAITCSAFNKESVEKIYKLKKRNKNKPLIILISSIKDISLFNINLNKEQKEILKTIWPDKITFIFSYQNNKFKYLHRNTKTLAFRVPNNKDLLKLLKKTGPIVVPSANIEGKKPATTIKKAKEYFKDSVDFYIDIGKLSSKPSIIINQEFERIR